MSLKLVLALACVISAGLVSGFPGGAPKSACNSLRPSHGASEQKSPSPYAFTLNATTARSQRTAAQSDDTTDATDIETLPAQGIQVTLDSPDGVEFAGYIVQARSGSDLVGSFSGDGKIVDCKGTQATVTHKGRGAKKSVSFVWVPPNDFEGEVIFKATVVKHLTKFWTGIESDTVSVSMDS